MQFSLRVTFFFSGINPAGLAPADASRIMLFELMMHNNEEETGRLITTEMAAFAGLGPRWCAYMASKAHEILPSTEVFEAAMPGMDARLRTNLATLLAGGFLALHGRVPTQEEAAAEATEFKATTAQHADDVDRDDALECVHHLFAYLINGVTVGQWLAREVDRAKNKVKPGPGAQVAESLDIVIKITGDNAGVFLLRGSPGLERVYANTKWAEGAWMHAIKKFEDAFVPQNPIHFPSMAKKARAIGLPLDLLPEPSVTWDEDDHGPEY